MCEECEQQAWPGIRTPSKSMPNVVYSNQIAWCLTLGFEYLTTIVGCFAHLWCVKQWNRRHSIGNAWQVLQRYNIEFALWRDWWGLLAYCLLNHLRRNLDFGWKLFELIKKNNALNYLPSKVLPFKISFHSTNLPNLLLEQLLKFISNLKCRIQIRLEKRPKTRVAK